MEKSESFEALRLDFSAMAAQLFLSKFARRLALCAKQSFY
jgi:hypothetical protein